MDTNVLLSGIFFGGLPRMVLGAWANSKFELLLTPAIFDEYLRTCERLATTRSGLAYESILATIAGRGTLVPDVEFEEPITPDPDDDKFMLCAREHDAVVISGDQDLLGMSGWHGVAVLTPREFLTQLSE